MTKLARLLDEFELSLRAENKSPATVESYVGAVSLLAKYLKQQGLPDDLGDISGKVISGWILYLLKTYKPATANNRYRGLQAFWNWAVIEEEVERNPMARLRPPTVPTTLVPVVSDDTLGKLFATMSRKTFADRRDTAMIRLLFDCGLRRHEVVGLKVGDVDSDGRTVTVMGKGRRTRVAPFGIKTAQAIKVYLRLRGDRPDAKRPELWLGIRGPITDSGLYQILETRCKEAGIERIHPHQLRHTFAHANLAAGMQEGDLMHLAGWRSRTMLTRYGASMAAERARAASLKLALGDRV